MPMISAQQPGQQPGGSQTGQSLALPKIMQAASQMAYKLAETGLITVDEAKTLTEIIPGAIQKIRQSKMVQQRPMMQRPQVGRGMLPGLTPRTGGMRPGATMPRAITIPQRAMPPGGRPIA